METVVEALRDQIWQFIGAILSTILGIVAILIAIRGNEQQVREKLLSYKIHYRTKLVNSPIEGQLQITYQGVKLSDPVIVIIEIENDGDIPIQVDDYARPIEIELYPSFHTVDAQILEGYRQFYGAEITNIDVNRIQLKPVMLNPGDAIILQIVADEIPIEKVSESFPPWERENIVHNVHARIIGVSEVFEVDMNDSDGTVIPEAEISRLTTTILISVPTFIAILFTIIPLAMYWKVIISALTIIISIAYVRYRITMWRSIR